MAVALGAGPAAGADKESCTLDNGIEHIVYIQFDNVRFRRDEAKAQQLINRANDLLASIPIL